MIDDGDLSLEPSAVTYAIYKPDDDPEFYLGYVAINYSSVNNPAWTTERHIDYKDADDFDESKLLSGEAAVLALRMLYSASEIALEMDPVA